MTAKAGNDVGELLRIFETEVNSAADTHFLFKHISRIANSQPAVLRALNSNVLAWGTIQYSLRISALTVLGRIFDDDANSLSAATFIRRCESNLDQFSAQAISSRKLSTVRSDELELREAIRGIAYEAHVATATDFEALTHYLAEPTQIYNEVYKPIRNKLVAHRDLRAIIDPSILEVDAKHGQLDDMVIRLLQVYLSIWQLFHNGRLVEASECTPRAEDRMATDVEVVMARIASVRN